MKGRPNSDRRPKSGENEEPKNKFRFESYIDRLSGIELKVGEDEIWDFGKDEGVIEEKWYGETVEEDPWGEDAEEATLEQQVKDQLSSTAFAESLKYWEGMVRYSEFVDLVKILRPYRYSLVHVLQSLELIVEELTSKITDCEYPETAEAVSFLIGALAKDTRSELLPMLPTIFESLSSRLENPFREVSITGRGGVGLYNEKVIQSVFSCTSTIFFYLSSYILRDLGSYLSIYRRWIYHPSSAVRHFSSESIAYALKKSKGPEIVRSLDLIFQFSLEEYNSSTRKSHLLNKWVSNVICNVVFSIRGCISTQGELVLRYLFRHLAFGLKIDPSLASSSTNYFALFQSSQQDHGIISSFLLQSMDNPELVCNENFQSICDEDFRNSFPALRTILQEILEEVRSQVFANPSSEGLLYILVLLSTIYMEMFQIFTTSEASFGIKSSSLAFSVQMLDSFCPQEDKPLHKKRNPYSDISGTFVLKLVLQSIQDERFPKMVASALEFDSFSSQNKENCHQKMASLTQIIHPYLDLISKVSRTSISSKLTKIKILLDSGFELDSYSPLPPSLNSLLQGCFKRSGSHSDMGWLTILLEISCSLYGGLEDGFGLMASVSGCTLDILSAFKDDFLEESINTMQTSLKYQQVCFEVILKSGTPENLTPYFNLQTIVYRFMGLREFGLDTYNQYFNNPPLVCAILKSCRIVLSHPNTELQSLQVALELIRLFYSEPGKIQPYLENTFTQSLKEDLQTVFLRLFGSNLEERTEILAVFATLEYLQIFKSFCSLFNVFQITQVSLETMISKVYFWMYSDPKFGHEEYGSLGIPEISFFLNSPSLSFIPLNYDLELISIIEVLFTQTTNSNKSLNGALGDWDIPGKSLRWIFLSWIASPLQEVRREASRFLLDLLSHRESMVALLGKEETEGKDFSEGNGRFLDIVQGVRLVTELENDEANIENERSKIRLIQQICDLICQRVAYLCAPGSKESYDSFLVILMLRSVVSQLNLRFSIVWKPVVEILTKLLRTSMQYDSENEPGSRKNSSSNPKIGSEFLVKALLSAVFNQIYSSAYRIGLDPEVYERFGFTDVYTSIEWSCRLLSQIRFSGFEEERVGGSHVDNCYIKLEYFRIQILYWLVQLSLEFEGIQEQLSILKVNKELEGLRGSHWGLLDFFPSKGGHIQKICSFLKVLETVLENRKSGPGDESQAFSFLLEKFVSEIAPRMLKINHIEIQMLLIRIISGFGQESGRISKYKTMFQGLISGSSKDGEIQSLRSNLLAFSLSTDKEGVIAKEDRDLVVPLVIRILLSKLGKDKEGPNKSNCILRVSRKGNKALTLANKRKVIISHLSGLPKDEMSFLLSTIIDPLVTIYLSQGPRIQQPGSVEDPNLGFKDEILAHIKGSDSTYKEAQGFLKSTLLDRILRKNNTLQVPSLWRWNNWEGETGFAFSCYIEDLGAFTDADLTTGTGGSYKYVILTFKQTKLHARQFKGILKFLSYLEHILNFMSHSLKDYSHVILIILANILHLANGYEEKIEESEESEEPEEPEESEEVVDELEDYLPREKKENNEVVFYYQRIKKTNRQVFTSISAILIGYPENIGLWEYILKPVSPIMLSSFKTNIQGLGGNSQISAIMNLMITISREEKLFRLYSSLFPEILGDFSTMMSQNGILEKISVGRGPRTGRIFGQRISGSWSSELLISAVVEVFLSLLLGGSQRVLLFLETFGTGSQTMYLNGTQNIRVVIVDTISGHLEMNENPKSNERDTGKFEVLISREGLKVMENYIPNIISSIQKVIYTRNMGRKSHRQEIIRPKELVLLKILALLEINKEAVELGETRNYSSLDKESTGIIVRIILLLLLSTICKINSRNEKTIAQNFGVLNLVSNLIKILDIKWRNTPGTEKKFDWGSSRGNLSERINSLIGGFTYSGEDRDEGSSSEFMILVSDTMSFLLLRTNSIRLRSTISEIFLFSELCIAGKDSFFDSVLALFNERGKKSQKKAKSLEGEEPGPMEDFSLKSLVGELFPLTGDLKEHMDVLIPVAVFGLNRQEKKRVLEPKGDLDLQLDILGNLEEILDLNSQRINILSRDLRLLHPLFSQLLYFIGGAVGARTRAGSGVINEDFSLSNLSSRFAKKLILSWCNTIGRIYLELDLQNEGFHSGKQDIQQSNARTSDFALIRSIYYIMIDLVIPFEEEILRHSRDLLIRRNVLQLVDVVVENFTPHLEGFSSLIGIPREFLAEKFHLGLYPVIKYTTVEDREEVRLFEELTHIQKHRRARALNFFGRFSRFSFSVHHCNPQKMAPEQSQILGECKDSSGSGDKKPHMFLGKYECSIPLAFNTIRTLGIPLALDALLQKNSSKETYHLSLGDNSLRSIEAFALHFDWRFCISLTGYLIKVLKLLPQRKTYIIKAVCSLLNSFDFQVNKLVVLSLTDFPQIRNQDPGTVKEDNSLEEQLTEMQMGIKQRLLPLLRSIMVDRSYKARVASSKSELGHTTDPMGNGEKGLTKHSSSHQHGVIRSEIVLVYIRVLRCLPSKQFHSELPRLVSQLILALKSKDREVRRSSRSSLKSVSKTLGVRYLSWILSQMSNVLTTGYQLPVLIFTSHSILHEMAISGFNSSQETGSSLPLDDCIQIVTEMIVEELNRVADPDKRTTSLDTIDTPITGSVEEGKYVRSPQLMRILSKNVSLEGCERLFEFLEDLLGGKRGDRGNSSVISDSFSQKYLYWLKNIHIQFCIGFIANENFGQNAKLKFSIFNLARGVVLDKNILKTNDFRNLVSSLSKKILQLFQDPHGLLGTFKLGVLEDSQNSREKDSEISSRKERYFKIQPGAAIGRGSHQVIKPQKGFERKVKSMVLSSSCLILINQLLKGTTNFSLPQLIKEDNSDKYLPMSLLLDHLLPLLVINFADDSSELASISCKCLIRALLIETMESSRSLGVFEMDYLGSLISRTALRIMERSGIASLNTSNAMVDLISSSMKLFVALLIRPKSIGWFNGLFFNQDLKKITPFYSNVLKQLHVTINDNRLRVTSLQLLRQIILYGKNHVSGSSESLESLYSLVDSSLPLIIQYSHMEPKIVTLGCNLYVEFLLYYPMSEVFQRKRVSILMENLPEYPTSEGRMALITAIHTLITRFPQKLVRESYSIMFLSGLALSLSTETESRPRAMIKEVVFAILSLYGNDNQARAKLVILVFKAIGTLNENLQIRCGLVSMLGFIFEFFLSRRKLASMRKEIGGEFEILFFSELNQLASILSSPEFSEPGKGGSIIYRLEYETNNLLESFIGIEFESFELISSIWFGKDKLENRKVWLRLWNLWVIEKKNDRGLNSGHLWVRSSALRLISNLLKQCLVGSSAGNSEKKNFLRDFISNPKVFTQLFSKVVPMQFNSLLEHAPWLAPKVLACIQHLILVSDFLREDWSPSRKLFGAEDGGREASSVNYGDLSGQESHSFYSESKERNSSKRIRISKENEVKEEDWLIMEEEEEGEEEEEEEGEEKLDDSSATVWGMERGDPSNGEGMQSGSRGKRDKGFSENYRQGISILENDNAEEVLDDYLLEQIDEDGNSNHLREDDEERNEAEGTSLGNTLVFLEKNSDKNKCTIRLEAYWWLIDRISSCCRFYSTRPRNFRVRILLCLKSLFDMIGLLPSLVDTMGNSPGNLTLFSSENTTNSIKHAARALYQTSTMLKREEFTESGASIYSITNFDWVQNIHKLRAYEVVIHICQFSQRTVEKWDKVFSDIGEPKVLLDSLSEARKRVMASRLERKSKLKLESIKNPEIAFKRKLAVRKRVSENRKRRLKAKVESRKLNIL
ncbi:Armadillo-type fold/WD40 repeat containing protein [Cryptosporidium felis]|nr:Armadillo-type fold/WD40 repeat containing protein [Cryptosporidium felis]